MDSSPPFSDLSIFNHVMNELIEVLIVENTIKSIKARIKNLIMYLERQQVTHLEERAQIIQRKLDVLTETVQRKRVSDSKKDDGRPSKGDIERKSVEQLNNVVEMKERSDEQSYKTVTADAVELVDTGGTTQYSDDDNDVVTDGDESSEQIDDETLTECSVPSISNITEMVKKEKDQTNDNLDDQIIVQLEVDTTEDQTDWKAMHESESEETPRTSFVCSVCSKQFTRNDSLKRHMAVHNRILFKCNSCSKEFSSKFVMETHICSESARNEPNKDQRNNKTETDDNTEDLIECPICNEEFISKAGVRRHLLSEHSVKSFSHVKCKKCQQHFETVEACKTHLEHHCFWKRDNANDTSDENLWEIVQKKKSEFKCLLCFEVFSRKGLLIAHEYMHTGQSPFKCEVCGKGFRFKVTLKKHLQTHSQTKPFNCGECQKTFRIQLDLNNHMRVHSDLRPFKCDQCEKRFKTKWDVGRHIKCMHLEYKPFMCDICGLSCFDKHTLRVHLRKHSDKPAEKVKCKICSKQVNKHSLRRHMDLHKDQRPYLCTDCGESFRTLSYLSMHKYSHMTEKPHKCTICSKSFATKHKLAVHENVHAGRKPYECEVCGKGSADKSNYYKHKKIHQNK